MHKLGQGSPVHFNSTVLKSTSNGSLAATSILSGMRVFPKPDGQYVCRTNERGPNFLSNIGASYIHREWTSEQEKQLLLHVQQYGEKSWSKTGRLLKKSAMECRDRWNTVLRPILLQAKRQQDLNNLVANKGRTSLNRTTILQKSRAHSVSQCPATSSAPNLSCATSPSPFFRIDNPANWIFLLTSVRSRNGSGGALGCVDENKRGEDRRNSNCSRAPLSNLDDNGELFDMEVESNGSLIDELDPNLSQWVTSSTNVSSALQTPNLDSKMNATSYPNSICQSPAFNGQQTNVQINSPLVKASRLKRSAVSPTTIQTVPQRRSLSLPNDAEEDLPVENYLSKSFCESLTSNSEIKEGFLRMVASMGNEALIEHPEWCDADREESSNFHKNFSLPWSSQSHLIQDKENWPESSIPLSQDEDSCINAICPLPALESPLFSLNDFNLDLTSPTFTKVIDEVVDKLSSSQQSKKPVSIDRFSSNPLEGGCFTGPKKKLIEAMPGRETTSYDMALVDVSTSLNTLPDLDLTVFSNIKTEFDITTCLGNSIMPLSTTENPSSTGSSATPRSAESLPDSHVHTNSLCLMEKFQSLLKKEVASNRVCSPINDMMSVSYWHEWINAPECQTWGMKNHYRPSYSAKLPTKSDYLRENKSIFTKESLKPSSPHQSEKPRSCQIVIRNVHQPSGYISQAQRVTLVRQTGNTSSDYLPCTARPLVTRRIALRSDSCERFTASSSASARSKMSNYTPFLDPHMRLMRSIRQVIQRGCDTHWCHTVTGSTRTRDTNEMVATAYRLLESSQL